MCTCALACVYVVSVFASARRKVCAYLCGRSVGGGDGGLGACAADGARAARSAPVSGRGVMIWLLWGWVVGVAAQLGQPRLWPWQGYAALVLGAVVLAVAGVLGMKAAGGRMRYGPGLWPGARRVAGCLHGWWQAGGWVAWAWAVWWMAVAACAAWGVTGWRAAVFQATALQPQWQGRDVVVQGVVDALPQTTAQGQRWVVAVERAYAPGRPDVPVTLPARIALSSYGAMPWAGMAATVAGEGQQARYADGMLGDVRDAAPDTVAGMHPAAQADGVGEALSALTLEAASVTTSVAASVVTPSGTAAIMPAMMAAHESGAATARTAATAPVTKVVRAGERWQWTVRLRPPHGVRNPHGFDAELWWWTQGVQATGYVRQHPAPRRLGQTGVAPVQRWRERVRDAVRHYGAGLYGAQQDVPGLYGLAQPLREGGVAGGVGGTSSTSGTSGTSDRPGSLLGADAGVSVLGQGGAAMAVASDPLGVVTALVTGDQAAIARTDWQLFRDTGVAHLVSISGLHITMFAWLAVGVTGWAWRRSARLCLWCPAPVAAGWAGLLLAGGYALFSGWGLPAQRTLGMLAVVLGLRVAGLVWPWPRVWLLVLALVVAWQPWAMLQAGFWLSFVAVGMLFAASAVLDGPTVAAGTVRGERGRHWSEGAVPSVPGVTVHAGRGDDMQEPHAQANVQTTGEQAGRGGYGHDGQGRVQYARACSATAALRTGGSAQPARGGVWMNAVHARARWRLRCAAVGRAVGGVVWGAVWRLLRTQITISLALAPLTVLLFGQVSVVGVLANLWAIPWVTLVLTPLSMLGVLWPPLWGAAAWCAAVMTGLLRYMAHWPGAVAYLPQPAWWAAVAGVAGCAWVAMPWPWRVRVLGVPLVLPMLLWVPQRPEPGTFGLLALDVGQGSAVLVQTAGHSVLFDAGPRFGAHALPGSDAGAHTIVPALRALGVQLDALIISHDDMDHAGGAASVLAAYPQARWMGNGLAGHTPAWALPRGWEPLLKEQPAMHSGHGRPARSVHPPPSWPPCRRGMGWQWDGVRFDILHPMEPATAVAPSAGHADDLARADTSSADASHTNAGRADVARPTTAAGRDNAHSCVLRIRAANGATALLTGDIGRAQERQLVQRGDHVRADVLLAPHHGSAGASSAVWVQAVQPRVTIFQTGMGNRFGHPAPAVVQRYAAVGSVLRNTAVCGAVHWQSIEPEAAWCERELRPRYWQYRPAVQDGPADAAPLTHGMPAP